MKNTLSKKQKNRRLAESALMAALSTVLSLFAVFKLPYGGNITLFSQVPIVLISYRYGVKWGVKAGLVMATLQLLFGLDNFSYVNGIVAYIVLAVFDYFVAFSALGMGGMLKNKMQNKTVGLAIGAALVSVIRFFCHFLTGVTIWAGYAGEGVPVWKYSLIYNGGYMLPELMITVIGVVIVSLVFDLDSETLRVRQKKITKM